MPSFSILNNIDSSTTSSLEVGTGQPIFPSLLRIKEQVDDRHQPSYTITCLADSSLTSAQCPIEDSLSFPFSADTAFDISRTRSTVLFCEESAHPMKRPCDSEGNGWRHPSSEQEHCTFENKFQQTAERNKNMGKRFCSNYTNNYSPERCARSHHDCQHPEPETYSIGSGNPSNFLSLN